MQVNDLGLLDLQDSPELDSFHAEGLFLQVGSSGRSEPLGYGRVKIRCVFFLFPQLSPVMEQQNPAAISNLPC